MIIQNESPSRLHADHVAWRDLFTAIDRRDAAAFVQFLTPDARFRFGNSPLISGRADIAAAVQNFFGMIAGCRHELIETWTGPSSAVCEGLVTYTVPRGDSVTIPFVNVLQIDGGLVSRYLIYIDNAPLFAALA